MHGALLGGNMRLYVRRSICWVLLFQLSFAVPITQAQSNAPTTARNRDISNSNQAPVPDPKKIVEIANATNIEVRLVNNQVQIRVGDIPEHDGTKGEKFLGIISAITRELADEGIDLNHQSQVWRIEIPNTYCNQNPGDCAKASLFDHFPISSAHAQSFLDRNIIITVDPSQSTTDRIMNGFGDYFKGAYGSENALATFLRNMGFVLQGMAFRYIVEAIAVGITQQASKRLFAVALGTLAAIKLAEKAVEWTTLYNSGKYEELGADMGQFIEAATFFILGNLGMKEFINACGRKGYLPSPKPSTRTSEGGGGKPRTVGSRTPSTSPRVANAPKIGRPVTTSRSGGSGRTSSRSAAAGGTATATMTRPATTSPVATSSIPVSSPSAPPLAAPFHYTIGGALTVESDSSTMTRRSRDVRLTPKSEAFGVDVSGLHFSEPFYVGSFAATGTLNHPHLGKINVRVIPMNGHAWAAKEFAAYQFSQKIATSDIRKISVPQTALAYIDGNLVAVQMALGRALTHDEVENKMSSILPESTLAPLDMALGSNLRKFEDLRVVSNGRSEPTYYLQNNGWKPLKGKGTKPIWSQGLDRDVNFQKAKRILSAMRLPSNPNDAAAWKQWATDQISETLRYFGDYTEEELKEISEKIKKLDEEKRAPASSGGKSDFQYLLEVINQGKWSVDHKAALERLHELCRERDRADWLDDGICEIVSTLLKFFADTAVDDYDSLAAAIIHDFSWLTDQERSDLMNILARLDLKGLKDLLEIKKTKGNDILREHIIPLFRMFVMVLKGQFDAGKLGESDVLTWGNIAIRLGTRFENYRSTAFKDKYKDLISAAKKKESRRKFKKLKAGFRDVGSDIEIELSVLARHLELASEYESIFDLVREVARQAKNEKQLTSMKKMVDALFGVGGASTNLSDWLQAIAPKLSRYKWSAMAAETRKLFIEGLFFNFFEGRGNGMNDLLPGIYMMKKFIAVKSGDFLGKSYNAGDVVDLTDVLPEDDVYFASHDADVHKVEIKFRLGKKQKLSSGDVEKELKKLMLLLGCDVTTKAGPGVRWDYWIHIHNVAKVPASFKTTLGKLRLFEYNIRTDMTSQFSWMQFDWVAWRSGFLAQHVSAVWHALQHVLKSPDNKLVMDPAKFFRTFSYVSLNGSDKYTRDENGDYLYGAENRNINEKIDHYVVNDAIQYSMVNEDYGISEEDFVGWLESRGYDLNNFDSERFVLDLYYLKYAETSPDNPLWDDSPVFLKEIMAKRGIRSREDLQNKVGHVFDLGSNVMPLFVDWSVSPVYYNNPESLAVVKAAQEYYLTLLLNMPTGGVTPQNVQVLAKQFVQAGPYNPYFLSFAQEGKPK